MDAMTALAASMPVPAAAQPLLPRESPLEMPIQSFEHGTLANPPRPSAPPAMAARRVYAIGGTLALTALAAYQIWWLLRGGGIDVLEGALLVLFVALFEWIALAFVAAVPGFLHLVTRRRLRLGLEADGLLPALAERTALLMPIYNEDPHRVMAGLQAVLESLQATGQGARFDAFVLSDTRKPGIAEAEEAAFAALRARLGDGQRVYYRRREHNSERKAGNIADWVRRFGGAYAHMLILDADSVMSGETIVRLAGAMERNPDVALIQSLPVIVNGSTVFARMQQFAARVYGPVIAHGVAWWHGAESNYWGHNAIIRTRAFAAHAGLPELSGRKPFGGTVLSHDFVEAALMRRGGWALHMVPGLAGSYEEGPPSLTDMLVRDRRWCQGNLQHSAVLPARGLHWISRMHLLIGIGHYFTAPMWAMLMLVGLAIPLNEAGIDGGAAAFSPWAYWRAEDPQRFLWVFALTMGLLLAPKILGFLAMLGDRATRRGCGGFLRATLSLLLETVLAALMAPITMYMQSRGVAEVLAGKDSGWESQRRDDGSLPLSGLLGCYGGLTLAGALAGIAAYLVSPGLAAWMSPVIAGLVLSIPIVALTSARRPGRWLRRARIFATPEELAPPPVLVRAAELRAQPHASLPEAPEPHL
jgi:membrane glycosyltransferase